jgi:hypothetical protein
MTKGSYIKSEDAIGIPLNLFGKPSCEYFYLLLYQRVRAECSLARGT